MGPVGVVIAVARRDMLQKRGLRTTGSVWGDADTVTDPDLERAKRLF